MDKAQASCFLNGEIATTISLFDRGLHYGHGLFETMRLFQGTIPLWDFHRRRIRRDAGCLGIEVDDSLLEQYLQQALRSSGPDGVIKLLLTAGEGGRGYAAPNRIEPNYLIQCLEMPDRHRWARGITVWPCKHRLGANSALAGIKHLNRLEQVLARAEQPPQRFPEGLMLDCDDFVVEGIASNLFCRSGSNWLTPFLDRCGVAGVMREYLMSRHSVIESRLTLADLVTMDELFVCNSVHGIHPVIAVQGVREWELGDETRQWQQQLMDEFPCFA